MSNINLVETIKANPGCVALVDNDCWQLFKKHPDTFDGEDDDYDDWIAENEIANDGSIEPIGDDGYGSGHCYGGDLLQALAAIVGIKVESV